MRLSEALQVVAGPAWRMSVDEVNREVCFVLRDAYMAQVKTAVSVSPALKGTVTAGVYPSPETSRNPYTGVLLGKKADPVVAGQMLAAKNGGSVSQSLLVPALQPPDTPVSVKSQSPSVSPVAPRHPFTGENLTGTTVPASPTPSPATVKPAVKTRPSSTVTAVKPTMTTVCQQQAGLYWEIDLHSEILGREDTPGWKIDHFSPGFTLRLAGGLQGGDPVPDSLRRVTVRQADEGRVLLHQIQSLRQMQIKPVTGAG